MNSDYGDFLFPGEERQRAAYASLEVSGDACVCNHSHEQHTGGRCSGMWSNPVGTYPCSCDDYAAVDTPTENTP